MIFFDQICVGCWLQCAGSQGYGPYNVIATIFVENRKHIDSLCKEMCVFWRYVVGFLGINRFSKTKNDLAICKVFEGYL